MTSQSYLHEYIEEVKEHLEELEDALLRLEQEGSDKERISQVFRAAHSIKGASAYMGYERLASLTHELENLISLIQSHSRAITTEGISVLLKCVDFISDALSYLQEKGEEPPLPQPLLDDMRRSLSVEAMDTSSRPLPPAAAPSSKSSQKIAESALRLETAEAAGGNAEKESEELPPRGKDKEECLIDDEDRELFGVFLSSFREHFWNLVNLISFSPEIELLEGEIESGLDTIRRLRSSAEYVRLNMIAGILKEWEAAHIESQEQGIRIRQVYAELVVEFGKRLQSALPVLELPALMVEESQESDGAIVEEDEELLSIFADTCQELFSELIALLPPSPRDVLSDSTLNRARELIGRMISSAHYMDYEHVESALDQWLGALEPTDGEWLMSAGAYAELLQQSRQLLKEALPSLDIPSIPRYPEPTEAIDEDEEELFQIFLTSLRQQLEGLTALAEESQEELISEEGARQAQELLQRIISSSRYMDYEKVVDILMEWAEAVAEAGIPMERDLYAGLLKDYCERLGRCFPALDLSFMASPEAEVAEALAEEDDDELLAIFTDTFRQHISEMSMLITTPLEASLDEATIRQARDVIARLISSAHYMDYDEIVNVLSEWSGSLGASFESGTATGHLFSDLLQKYGRSLERILPGLKLHFQPMASQQDLPRSGILPRERNDSRRQETGGPRDGERGRRGDPPGIVERDTAAEMADQEAIAGLSAPGAEVSEKSEGRAIPPSGKKRAGITVRVEVKKIDTLLNQVGELVITRSEFVQTQVLFREMLREFSTQGKLSRQDLRRLRSLGLRLGESTMSLGRVATGLQESVMRVRMLPISQLLQRFPRVVRDQALKLGKKVDLFLEGGETEVDKRVLEQMYDPLVQFLRNAIVHGIESVEERRLAGKPETGVIRLRATHEEDRLLIEIQDDGRGIDTPKLRRICGSHDEMQGLDLATFSDEEMLYCIFLPGVSTRDHVDGAAGRGVGLDVVRKNVERINGSIHVESEPGAGTRFIIRLPLTVAIIRALLVKATDQVLTVPLSSVSEILRYNRQDTYTIEGFEVISLRGRTVPLVHLGQLLNMGGMPSSNGRAFIVIVATSMREVGLVVNDLIGEQEVVIKPIEDTVHPFDGISGATILGDGTVSLILDIATLLQSMKEARGGYIKPQRALPH